MSLTASPQLQPQPQPVLVEVPEAAAYRSYRGIMAFLLFLVLGMFLVRLDSPPRPLDENAPPTEFSAGRAVKHLAEIARAPHPINSTEHDRVRDYLVRSLNQLGLAAQVQKTHDINDAFDVEGSLENIVARLKGSNSSEKAVLLVAHYDSVPAGPGASDDGAAVAALLESARALKALPKLRKDVLFLFTDGEERHLLGARAFASEHPWMRDVGLVLNFEARGIGGPSIMFETSRRNGWLISNFARAASHPVANSLSYEIYKRLPNDTDFTVFKHEGVSGLNFAYIDGLMYYHSAQDTVQNMDLGSLQQHGDYALELTQWFGNMPSEDPKLEDAIYFDVSGGFLVHYSPAAGNIFLTFSAVLLAVFLYRGLRSGLLRIGGGLIGVASMVIAGGVGVVVAVVASRLLASVHSARIENGLMYHSGWYIVAFCAAGLACAAALSTLAAKRIGSANLLAGTFIVWMAATIAVAVYLPGGSYLLLWPFLFSVLGATLGMSKPGVFSAGRNVVALLGLVPALVLIVPMAHKIFFAFDANSTVIVSVLSVLLLSLCMGQLGPENMPKSWTAPGLLALIAAGALLIAITFSA
jgi:hypothetical protein